MKGYKSNTGDYGPAPKSPSDKKLSARHHRESIAFNERHAKDHAKEVKKHRKALRKMRFKPGKTKF